MEKLRCTIRNWIKYDHPFVANYILIWEFGGQTSLDPFVPANSGKSVDSIIQQDTTQKYGKSQCPWIATKTTTIKKQGCSKAVVLQIEAQFIRQSELFMQK